MSTRNIHKLMALLIIAVFAVAHPQMTQAAGTLSNTTISNSATVNYQVGGVGQAPVTSAAATFVVDNKVNLTVAPVDVAAVPVIPGASNQVLRFTVTNTGNTVQDYGLTPVALPNLTANPFGGGLTDTFDATLVGVYVESGATAGFQAAEDLATYIDELAPDASATVYIVVNIPGGQVNNDLAVYALRARTKNGGGAGAQGADTAQTAGPNTAGVDVVFADVAGSDDTTGANDGEHSVRSAYVVTAAAVTITKTSAIYSDPVNGTGANRKAIPGSIITYTITVANAAGGQNATNVAITDSLNAEITAVPPRLAFNTTYDDGTTTCVGPLGIVVDADGSGPGLPACRTNTNDGDGADWNLTAGNTVTVTGLTVNQGTEVTVSFQVVIQ